MILEQNKANIETYGDIQQNKVSIDPRNAEHIISILSSNLYSTPKESFLRETISNAVDSHKEAGTEEPIILLFKKNGSTFDIIIRDYGTGISPERFDQIYKFIGSSTKRESNEYIGSFGIGRFSALACADVVHITSYYNGIANVYVMAKNGGGIDIDLISSFQTDEKNGVEVKINVSENSLEGYVDGIKSLSYITNLFVKIEGVGDDYRFSHYKTLIDRFNDRNIIRKNTFCCNTAAPDGGYRTFWIVLGDILYVVDSNKIDVTAKYPNLRPYELSNQLMFIQIPFEIGTLDVTPTREALLYSKRTVDALHEKIYQVLEELYNLYNDKVSNCTNILDYWLQTCRKKTLSICDGSNTLNIPMYIDNSTIKFTFKKKELPKGVIDYLERILYTSVSKFPISIITSHKGTVTSVQKNHLSLRDVLYSDRGYSLNNHVKVIQIGNDESVKKILVRSYAINKYRADFSDSYNLFITNMSLRDFYSSVLGTIVDFDKIDAKYKLFAVREIIRALKDKFIIDDIENSEEFKLWKEDRKKDLKGKQRVTSEKPVIGYITYRTEEHYCYDRTNKPLEFKNLAEFNMVLSKYTAMTDKEREKPIIYGELHSPYWEILEELSNNNHLSKFIVVKFAKTNLKYFKNVSKKWISVEDYVPKMKELKKYLTFRKFKDDSITLHDYDLEKFVERLMPSMVQEDKDAVKLCTRYFPPTFKSSDCDLLNEILKKAKENSKYIYDMEFKEALETYYKYMNLAKKVGDIVGLFGRGAMLAYFLMKRKLFRMNYDSYSEIQELIKLTVK